MPLTDLDDYAKWLTETEFDTRARDIASLSWASGISAEAGELLNLIRKTSFRNKHIDRDELISEMGDVLHYLMRLMAHYNLDIMQVIAFNVTKIDKRLEEKPDYYDRKDISSK